MPDEFLCGEYGQKGRRVHESYVNHPAVTRSRDRDQSDRVAPGVQTGRLQVDAKILCGGNIFQDVGKRVDRSDEGMLNRIKSHGC